jgi:hypothetical protein
MFPQLSRQPPEPPARFTSKTGRSHPEVGVELAKTALVSEERGVACIVSANLVRALRPT